MNRSRFFYLFAMLLALAVSCGDCGDDPTNPDPDAGTDATEDTGGTEDVAPDVVTEPDMGTDDGGPACGNGVIEDGETCDDGNTLAGDGCDATCQDEPETCTDNTLNQDETGVDCGGTICNACPDGMGCSVGTDCVSGVCNGMTCSPASCGDGIVNDAAEECDGDGNGNGGQTANCDVDCSAASCGDGVINSDAGETCDGDGMGTGGETVDCDTDCTASACGDGNVNVLAAEDCDGDGLGNGGETIQCNLDCTASSCGDGIRNATAGEQCDGDGAGNGGLTAICDTDCTNAICGDAFVNNLAGEACDDGNNIDTDGCSNQCLSTTCGDGVINNGEACDDGNANDLDACNNNCIQNVCGDGIVNNSEECDDQNFNEFDACNNACRSNFCGDGITNNGEQCDDANSNDLDGCNNSCVSNFCGDGVTNNGEQCDDGNQFNGDACNNICVINFCGDGIVNNGELCDDANLNPNDGCNNLCLLNFCGDGIINNGEQCDDGGNADGDGCSAVCVVEFCGDNIVNNGEECDDGGVTAGDGCDSACVIEFCGDGILNNGGGEQCDDGNTADDDGCNAGCLVECLPDLVAPANGTVSDPDGLAGDVRDYTCDAGYTLSGAATTTCQLNGTWNNPPPVCFPSLCAPPLTAPANGTVSGANGTVGQSQTYTCNAGHTLNGSATTTCQADSTWSTPEPTCDPDPCAPNLVAPTNGSVSGTTGNTGDSQTYSCDTGYGINGSPTTTCQADGTWSTPAPTCEAGFCSPGLNAPANGSVTGTSGTTGVSQTYSCDAGFTLNGVATTTCQANGTWTTPEPTCVANACAPNLVSPTNGTVDSTTGVTNDVSNYTCDMGFTLNGSATNTCQADGTWSDPAPTCVPNPCPGLSVPGNGAVSSTMGVTGDIVTYACNAGYTLSSDPDTDLECLNTGAWDAPEPTCVANFCAPDLVDPVNGAVSQTTGQTGDLRTYSCDTGYTLTGATTVTCLTTGAWNLPAPTCEPNTCAPDLVAPTNGTVDFTTGVTTDVRNYACDVGYTLSGSTTTTCQIDGSWSDAAPVCVPNACAPALVPPTNGTVDVTTGVTGDVRNYACNAGYTLSGSSTTECLTSGAWDNVGSEPTCVANACAPDLVSPTNGTVSSTTGTTGQTSTYSCDLGFTLNGSNATTCQTDGTWSDAAPTCDPDACPVLNVPANGGVSSTTGVTGDIVNYACDAGYTLSSDPDFTLECLNTSVWDAPEPTCIPNPCAPVLQLPTNGTVSSQTGNTGDVSTYSCNTGYTLIGVASATCQTSGTWTDPNPPTCLANPCGPPLSDPDNGDVSGPDGVTGTTRTYTCDTGFTINGPDQTTCQPTGSWSPDPTASPTTCDPNSCGFINNPTNGVVDGAAMPASGVTDQTVVFGCDAGYGLQGASTSTCLANGNWSQTTPLCVAGNCPTLSDPANGDVFPQTGGPGTTANYSCDAGYTLSGAAATTCQVGGAWSPDTIATPPVCNANPCAPDRTAPTNGTVNGGTAPVQGFTGDSVTYDCNSGFVLNGAGSSLCLASGSWSQPTPTCVSGTANEFTFTDRINFNDIASDALRVWFQSQNPSTNDYIFVEMNTNGQNNSHGAICMQRADWYRDQYINRTGVTGGTNVLSGSWQKWERSATSNWSSTTTSQYRNYYGNNCWGTGGLQYAWCPDWGLNSGGGGPSQYSRIIPQGTGSAQRELYGDYTGYANRDWTYTVRIGSTRIEACGF